MRYKFRYLNGIYKTAAAIVCPLQNFFLVWAIFFLVLFLINKIAVLIGFDNLINDTIFVILRKIIFLLSTFWAVVYCVCRKGVYVYNNHLVVARYTVTLTNWKNRITISYDEIESVSDNFNDLHYTKHKFSMVVPCGDESYNVELTLKNGKKYFFSIEDQEEFCDNINLLIEKSR